jgi:hypothetical protein
MYPPCAQEGCGAKQLKARTSKRAASAASNAADYLLAFRTSEQSEAA